MAGRWWTPRPGLTTAAGSARSAGGFATGSGADRRRLLLTKPVDGDHSWESHDEFAKPFGEESWRAQAVAVRGLEPLAEREAFFRTALKSGEVVCIKDEHSRRLALTPRDTLGRV